MTDRLDLLLHHCADLGIDVEWQNLESRHGHYKTEPDRITLHRCLTHRQAVSTLAHELGHRAFGDRCSTPPIERRAWEYAAAFLIGPADYARAEREVGHHQALLAIELGVTPKVIEAWRRWWLKRGHLMYQWIDHDL